jgi:hypothetical protein
VSLDPLSFLCGVATRERGRVSRFSRWEGGGRWRRGVEGSQRVSGEVEMIRNAKMRHDFRHASFRDAPASSLIFPPISLRRAEWNRPTSL